MDGIMKIIALVSACLGLISLLIGLITPLVKNKKARKALETAQKWTNAIRGFVVEAEKIADMDGDSKRDYVLDKAQEWAKQNNIEFDKKQITQTIEDIITLSKQINPREKDKEDLL